MHANITVSWICMWASVPWPGRREDCFAPNLSQDSLRVPPDDCHHFPLASPLFIRFLVSPFIFTLLRPLHIPLSISQFLFAMYALTLACWPTFHFLVCRPLECALKK